MTLRKHLNELETPAPIIDLDVLASNISRMQARVSESGKRLRPHLKTHKLPEIARMQGAAGASGVTVAKPSEARIMAAVGVEDIFIAHQVVDPRKLEALAEIAMTTELILAADSVEVVNLYAAAVKGKSAGFKIRIEVDTGLGRAGVQSNIEALEVATAIERAEGLRLEGMFTHEGHLYRYPVREEREREAQHAAQRLKAIVEAVRDAGIEVKTVSMGSTPGAEFLVNEAGIDELRPGNYVFNDVMQVRLGSATFAECALSILATVVSVRAGGRVLIDAGTKALASDCPFPDRTYGVLPEYPEVVFVSANEEHGYLDAPVGTFRVGDRVRVISNHACTCLNMHDEVWAIRDEQVEARWGVMARGAVT